MQLLRLELHNFRSFYGDTSIEFSTKEDRLVTIIHGENGVGKTTILNAMYWCFSGKFTPNFGNPSVIVNRAAYKENPAVECFAEIHFKHGDDEYRARRSIARHKEKAQFNVFKTEAGGISRKIEKPDTFIDRVIPPALQKWVFWDAEQVNGFSLSGSDGFKRDVRRTLGFELMDTLVTDLEACLSKKRKDLTRIVRSKDVQAIQKLIDDIQAVLPNQEEELINVKNAITTDEKRLEEVNTELRKQPDVREFTKKRDHIEATIKNKKREKLDLNVQLIKLVGESMPAVLLYDLAISFENQLKIKENSGKLPAPYSDQLVDDILEDQSCICGRPVKPGSAEESKIKELLKSASTGNLNARIKSIQYLIKDIIGTREKYPKDAIDLRKRISNAETEIGVHEEELLSIKNKISESSKNSDAVATLERERSDIKIRLHSSMNREGTLSSDVARNKNETKTLQDRHRTESQKIGHGESISSEMNKIQSILDYIIKSTRELEHRALLVLSQELNNSLLKNLDKHFTAAISTDNYAVRMHEGDGNDVGESTGQGQLLKYFFMSAVLAVAGRKTQEKIKFLIEPTVMPLVLDAPFSTTDEINSSVVAKVLATQTSQLILFLKGDSYKGAVEKVLTDYIGEQYVLVQKVSGQQGEKPLKNLKIRDKSYALTSYDEVRDQSIIVKV